VGEGGTGQALPAEAVRPFVPETLRGLRRTSFALTYQVEMSSVVADYSDDSDHMLRLEIFDTGRSMTGVAAVPPMMSVTETDHGYERASGEHGRLVHERWDSRSGSGEVSATLASGFMVRVSGSGGSIGEIKAAFESLDLAGLEALRAPGKKKN
jgi:hypothetical protein